jgi:hypothetical protein
MQTKIVCLQYTFVSLTPDGERRSDFKAGECSSEATACVPSALFARWVDAGYSRIATAVPANPSEAASRLPIQSCM